MKQGKKTEKALSALNMAAGKADQAAQALLEVGFGHEAITAANFGNALRALYSKVSALSRE